MASIDRTLVGDGMRCGASAVHMTMPTYLRQVFGIYPYMSVRLFVLSVRSKCVCGQKTAGGMKARARTSALIVLLSWLISHWRTGPVAVKLPAQLPPPHATLFWHVEQDRP